MAAATGAGLFSAVLSPAAGRFKFKRKVSVSATVTPTQPPAFTVSDNGRLHEAAIVSKRSDSSEAMPEDQRLILKDYFELSKDMIRSDGGPPRWFSPFECGSRLNGSPLLRFLPGIDGVGLGLILQHQRLGEIFDIWCLHIPVMDRTPLADLVELVERPPLLLGTASSADPPPLSPQWFPFLWFFTCDGGPSSPVVSSDNLD